MKERFVHERNERWFEQVLEIDRLSIEKVLFDFFECDFYRSREYKFVASRIEKVGHIGISIPDIDIAVEDLKSNCPDKEYGLVRKFDSVILPKIYDGSTGVIAQVKSNKDACELELFCVDWKGKYKNISEIQKNKLIEHIALNTIKSDHIQEIINCLTKYYREYLDISDINFNRSSNELFCYIKNSSGNKLELQQRF